MSFSYCLVKKNCLYQTLYAYIEKQKLNMYNPNHYDLIKDHIKCFLDETDYITTSEKFGAQDTLFEHLLDSIITDNNISLSSVNDEDEKIDVNNQGNTMLAYGDSKKAYEIVYTEFFNNKEIGQLVEVINEFGSITNIDMVPIYGSCGLLKTVYKSNDGLKLSTITKNDVYELIINTFYHSGVLINTDGTMTDLVFSGEDPCYMIGSAFKISDTIQLLGLSWSVFVEKDGKVDNVIVSEFLSKPIKGRAFITVLCPVTNKKFINITLNEFKDILELLKDKNKIDSINKDYMENINVNPFFLINKYK
jgi:hypothetical protein